MTNDDGYTADHAARGIGRLQHTWGNFMLRCRFVRDAARDLLDAGNGRMGAPTVAQMAHRLGSVIGLAEAAVRDFAYLPVHTEAHQTKLARARALLDEADTLLRTVRDDTPHQPLDGI